MKYIPLLVFFFPLHTWSASIDYKPVIGIHSSVKYALPYSMGTHRGRVKRMTGTVSLDLEQSMGSGELHVPIDSIDTGNKEQDCHLIEAMGLNYRVSDFPKEHTCDKNDHVATSGKNSVAYPEIIFKISSIKASEKAGNFTVSGVWTIHGISHPSQFDTKIIHQGNSLKIQGEIQFSLKDYGVEVKSAHILFVTISVKDEVSMVFDLELSPI